MPTSAASEAMAIGAIVAPCTAGIGRALTRLRPCSRRVTLISLFGVTASAVRMNTTGTAPNNTHWTWLRRESRQADRAAAASWTPAPAGFGCRWREWRTLVRLAANSHAAPIAATVQATAQPRSAARSLCPDGRSTIHRVTKWVGSPRVASRSTAPIAGPKNTSKIHTNSTMTVPLTGLPTKAPTMAPIAT